MAARLSCMLFLLEEAKREDDRNKRFQARQIRSLRLLSTNKDYINLFRLSEELITQMESDLYPLFPTKVRRDGLSNRTKVPYFFLNVLIYLEHT